MELPNPYPICAYRDIQPLCEKGHVVLTQNETDGQLYVKKQIRSYNPALYHQLRAHPVANTPTIYAVYAQESTSKDAGEDLVVIEEYFPGHTLAEHMEEKGLFSEKEAIAIGLQLCRILMDLHQRKPAIIHRDIKPSNVMLLSDGTVKLLDFNAAKAESSEEKRDTVLLGTAGFAAPEQYGFSSSTPQTDIYAMGVLLNIMLTGVMPWERVAGGKLNKIIRRCLKMNPKDRYAGAWELYHALKRARAVRCEWLPPGFRTMHPLKILLAVPGYLFLFLFPLKLDSSDVGTSAERDLMRLTVFLLGLFPLLFYSNYLGVRRWFPFMRSPHKELRILGLVLAPVFLFLLLILLLIFLHLPLA